MMIPSVGQRIRLTKMEDDPHPIPVGTTGTVSFVTDLRHYDHTVQVGVKWDIKRSLALILPRDEWEPVDA
jgi:hypothetical protein